MPLTPSALPLLLAGPILRRVKADLVVRSHGAELQPNLTYSYDLRIFDSVRRHSLRTLGLLSVPTPLGYDIDELPSFVMCPQDLDRLVIVHGSCRQLFAVPPVQDDPVDDDDPFVPPGGWPGEEPKLCSPKYKSPKLDPDDADTFPDDTFPYLPKRDGMLWIDELIAARGPTAFVETTDTLVDVLRQTLTLTRLRMQPATTFSRGGLTPWAWLGQRPGSTGISFTL